MVLLAGYTGISRPVGNGIVLGGVKNALVERCEAYGNGGWNTNPGGGPVGCAIIKHAEPIEGSPWHQHALIAFAVAASCGVRRGTDSTLRAAEAHNRLVVVQQLGLPDGKLLTAGACWWLRLLCSQCHM